MKFELSPDHAYPMLAGCGIALQVSLTAMRPMRQRIRLAKKLEAEGGEEYKTLVKEHADATGGQKVDALFPDTGSGRYSALLSYADWLSFNVSQRVHQNYLENVPATLFFLAVGGVFYPRFAGACGAGYIVAREIYAWGYTNRGPRGRVVGAMLGEVFLVSLLGAAVTGAVGLLRSQ